MIELTKTGDINVKKLTTKELDILVDMRLAYHKRRLDEIQE